MLLTWDPQLDDALWLTRHYFPQIRAWDRERSRALATVSSGLEALRADLASGEWERRFGHLRDLTEMDLGYRLLAAAEGSGASR